MIHEASESPKGLLPHISIVEFRASKQLDEGCPKREFSREDHFLSLGYRSVLQDGHVRPLHRSLEPSMGSTKPLVYRTKQRLCHGDDNFHK